MNLNILLLNITLKFENSSNVIPIQNSFQVGIFVISLLHSSTLRGPQRLGITRNLRIGRIQPSRKRSSQIPALSVSPLTTHWSPTAANSQRHSSAQNIPISPICTSNSHILQKKSVRYTQITIWALVSRNLYKYIYISYAGEFWQATTYVC